MVYDFLVLEYLDENQTFFTIETFIKITIN